MYAKHVKWQDVCIKGSSSVYVQCMINAWTSTHGAKCVKHTTKDQNMLNMNKYVKPQNLVLIGVQESEKKRAFY